MAFLAALLPRSPAKYLLAAFILQTLYILFFHHSAREQAQIQRTTLTKHYSLGETLAHDISNEDHGLMSIKVAALSDLAEHYLENPSLDTYEVNAVVSQLLPWWNPSTLKYYPWKKLQSWKSRIIYSMESRGPSTGIVISVMDSFAKEAAHLIGTLRNVHGCKLPISIAYVGDDDLRPQTREFLRRRAKDISFIDLTTIFDEELVHLQGYAIKPFALLASPYPRTILMDADAIFFSKPDTMFDEYPSLRDTGALFFHDRNIISGFNRQDWLERQMEAAGRDPSASLSESSLFYRRLTSEEADAAVVCVDKSRVGLYMAVLFMCWMNTKDVREASTFRIWHGDKESYWVATELMGVPYSFEPWYSARMSQSQETGIPLLLDDDNEWKKKHPRPAVSASSNNLETPPPDHSSCTLHMAHSDAWGIEPLWANGALWYDKGNKDHGLSNWTHWYLGERVHDVLQAYDPKPESDGSGDGDDNHKEGDDDEATKKRQEELEQKILATQPEWLFMDWPKDYKTCFKRDQPRWRQLSRDFRARLERMQDEVRRVEIEYEVEMAGHD
ncbi:uncharacterized protein Z520_09569 [Fonsecaea multimorphosa CBS 102226]|uniref:Glycosyltransferase family 71 protein n=1 Tax=Fonsecaea multimorphosa CBS 102226 TaxID=1442371 RepID=A0A0D2JWJ5_9EURO|nr:uncharacterized protein Z520_09569 [Fonsecaea multimorphosa CBS 102226]KIX94879.1 hypothetical protein Z520_09569 [Fonsecaea multimorphosa CBS 102226]OAL20456.1 hypothetical protein AYO22_08950 [Fonsecaea multimorphosa]